MGEVPAGQITTDFGITGTTFIPGATQLVQRIPYLARLTLQREPDNRHDKNAVAVVWGHRKVGFVPRGLAAEIAPIMDAGISVIAQRKRDVRFGLCQIAYVPPQPEAPTKEVPDAESESAADPLDEAGFDI